MKNLLLLFASFILLNCSTQNQSNETSTESQSTPEPINEPTQPVKETYEPETPLTDDNFNSFLIKFSENEQFQLARVDFPLTVKVIDIEDNKEIIRISKDEWQHEDLLDTMNIETSEVDAYSQYTELADSTATIKLRGIDNGIRVDYNFQLRNGSWFLSDILNAST